MTNCPFTERGGGCWHGKLSVLHKPTKYINSVHLSPFPVFFLRHWGKREEHIHQTDEDYSWRRLLRRGQKGFHKTGLSEHLHGHAGHDPSHGDAQDPLQIRAQQGNWDPFAQATLNFFNWHDSEGWRERGKDATKWPQRPCVFLECCLSYLEQPSIIVSCPFWHFLCPQSTPTLHHTLRVFVFPCVFLCTQIHVCIYTHTHTNTHMQIHKRGLPHTTHSEFLPVAIPPAGPFFFFLICTSYSCTHSFGSCYNDLLLYSLFPVRVTNERKRSVAVIPSATFFL